MIGIAITCSLVFCGFMKWLRNDRLLLILVLATAVLAIIGIVGRIPENPRLNTWDGLLGPFAYVGSYALLRHWYKKVFRREPTYQRASWYDHEEGRRLDWYDVTVHVLPMCVGLGVPVIATFILG
ncbi:MAG: hypothetical protein H6592_15160 [Flavobacteriales bacterium]|nr:hypothetical protein [Flavobacteriales bacterium]MCB9165750.1 hypothetical protein [Flavobacteriales bacterium]